MPRIEQIRAMLDKDPDDTFLLFALGMEQFSAGKYDDAIAGFDRVIEIDPTNDAAYMQKANALLELKQPEAARQALEIGMAVARDKGDEHARDNMHELYEMIRPE